MNSRYCKNFIYNFFGSMANACISLFLLIIVTRINGINYAGIFSFSFSMACVFQVIATYSGRTYQVTELNKTLTDSDYIYTKFICCFVMMILSIIFIIIRNYNFEKSLILLLLMMYKMIESFEDVFYGIMQKNDELYKVGISLFFRGIGATLLFLIIDFLTNNLIFSVLSIVIYSVLQIIFYDLVIIKNYNFKMKKFNLTSTKRIFIFGFCTFLLTFLTQYMLNATKYSIDNYLSDNFQTIFGIIVMPATVVILFGQLIIHPFLTKLIIYVKSNNIKMFNKLVLKLSLLVLCFGLLSDFFAYLIGIPVLELIYSIKLNAFLLDLVLIIFGASLFGITFIISNSLITLRDTFSQVIIFFVSSIFTYFLSDYLVFKYSIHGAVYSYVISMFFLMTLFIFYYIFKMVLNKNKFNYKEVLYEKKY